MKFTILLLSSCFLLSLRVFAQNPYSVKGAVADTATNTMMYNAAVAVLNAKDSTMVNFSRVTRAGSFEVKNLNKGNFILLITYPEYADYVEEFSLDSAHTQHDFGKIGMLLKAKLLAAVIIKGTRAAIKIKGDTTEFDPRAFKIQPNATVEDLLKQLPGIQVDKDGKITAQGQTVPKVLVDGEEFFGDDPTLVTKNLRADMVDKVQLYDKKSDQATFTGIDDGEKTKTINIQLKADKKNGYFGKAEGGAGSDGYYQGSVMFNRFKGKTKFSAYGILANTGKTGLGWEDGQKYGTSGANVEFGDDGGIMFYVTGTDDGLDSFGGQYNGHGIPIARTGGVHYDTKFAKDNQSLNLNYKIGSLTVDGTENTLSQNNTPDGSINSASDRLFHNYLFRQKLDGMYNIKLDTTQNLKIMFDATLKNGQTRSNYNYLSQRGDGTRLNSSNRDMINDNDGKIFDVNAFYTKKFKKKGRTFSLNVSENINNSTAHGFLKYNQNFYNDAGVIDSTAVTDQRKTSSNKSAVLTTNATYTEPLSKELSVILNYAFKTSHGTSDQRSFDQSAPGQYDVQDDSLSNDYRLNELSHQVGAIFNIKSKKMTFNFGSKVSSVNFDQLNQFTNVPFKRTFINWAPQGFFQYKLGKQESIYAFYNGNTSQPSINQIQPVANNSDPNNIIVGNPDLRPSFRNRLSISYNSYKVISGQSFYVYGSYSFTSNPIVSNVTTNLETDKSVSKYVNLNGKTPFNFNVSADYNKKIEAVDFNVGIRVQANGSTSYSMSNDALNRTTYNNYSGQLTLSKYKEKKYDMYVSFGPNYTFSNSSLLTSINNNGRGFATSGNLNFYLPGKFQIGSDVDYQFTAKTQTFDQDLKKTIWNASLVKTFFKNDDLKLTLAANDLLNQNVGFSRNVNGNYLQQDSYTTIKRYFMFTVTWNFNSMNSSAKK
ncbi:MAG TPA: outer membrane beta-barrel family protein [Mucilaginibacter sp.]|nr:outer membrane beta-barrel family protein [Mucilaginibacter sp.]